MNSMAQTASCARTCLVSNADPVPNWTVLLLGGASGIGKSTLAKTLGIRYGVPVTSGDDIVNGVMAMTSPSTHPVIHRWDTDPVTRS